jgi:hypothetical protein
MVHKAFATQRRAASGETVSFELPEGSGRIYSATPDAPGGVLLVAASIDSETDTGAKLRMLGTILDQVLLPESRDRFEEAFNSPDPAINIGMTDVVEVIRWLISEVYVGKATAPASPSPATDSTSGPSSTGAAPLPVSSP